MGFEMPQVPRGSGEHPIALVVVTANNLAASGAFYSKLFGWQLQPFSAELAGVVAPGGPTGALRSNVPAGFPGMVPYIGVRDMDAILSRLVAGGGTIERAPWILPGVSDGEGVARPNARTPKIHGRKMKPFLRLPDSHFSAFNLFA